MKVLILNLFLFFSGGSKDALIEPEPPLPEWRVHEGEIPDPNLPIWFEDDLPEIIDFELIEVGYSSKDGYSSKGAKVPIELPELPPNPLDRYEFPIILPLPVIPSVIDPPLVTDVNP